MGSFYFVLVRQVRRLNLTNCSAWLAQSVSDSAMFSVIMSLASLVLCSKRFRSSFVTRVFWILTPPTHCRKAICCERHPPPGQQNYKGTMHCFMVLSLVNGLWSMTCFGHCMLRFAHESGSMVPTSEAVMVIICIVGLNVESILEISCECTVSCSFPLRRMKCSFMFLTAPAHPGKMDSFA